MTKERTHKQNGIARPIKTKKDYSGAASVVEKIKTVQPDPETVAEKRLQSLLKEMEKFDGDSDESEEGGDAGYAGPLRRWSDESGGTE